jgi:hypothetical protein
VAAALTGRPRSTAAPLKQRWAGERLLEEPLARRGGEGETPGGHRRIPGAVARASRVPGDTRRGGITDAGLVVAGPRAAGLSRAGAGNAKSATSRETKKTRSQMTSLSCAGAEAHSQC